MTEKIISKKSLQNLKVSNKESRKLTREALETALLLLLEKKTLSQITISELVAKAGVSRNAFYRNYKSKEAILESILTQIVRRIFRGLKGFDLKNQLSQAWLFILNEAKKEAQVLGFIFEQHLEKLLTSIVSKRLKAYQRFNKKHDSHYTNSFWSNAIISVLSNWVADDMRIPAEEVAAIGLPLFL